MDTSLLQAINPFVWTLASNHPQSGRVLFYANEELLKSMDDKVLTQISNVACLPGLTGPAMTMPDAHWGYGFPIGGVAAFDAEKGGIISAGGVGFDISCGIRCLRTNLHFDDIKPFLMKLGDALLHTVPAGVGQEGLLKLTPTELDGVLRDGAYWAVKQGYGKEADLEFVEEQGRIVGAIPDNVSEHAKKRQYAEMGTLGSGNHYLEVQVVDHIFDKTAASAYGLTSGQIVISIHCGSRGLGHQIGTDYLLTMVKIANELGIHLPERELACAPIHSFEGQQYLGAMNAGINCALANRQIIAHLVQTVFSQLIPEAKLETLYDVSHNTCKLEEHVVDGHSRQLYVHRKGATRAFGPGNSHLPARYREVGQPVIIGGSMGTGSYILAGNSATQNHAFASASHGAGRILSRHQALKQWKGKTLQAELAEQGIIIYTHSLRGLAEEAPDAYKDVNAVAEVTELAGLARRVVSLKPKLCVKG